MSKAITKKEMIQMGKAHAEAGKTLTPNECQSVDQIIFAASKAEARPAKFYATMRGAFNKGWEVAYFQVVA